MARDKSKFTTLIQKDGVYFTFGDNAKGYEKYEDGWILKGSRGQIRQPSVTTTLTWFNPFYQQFTAFSETMQIGIQSLQTNFSALKVNYSSLDECLSCIEKHLISSSHTTDPMDISSTPISDDGSDDEDSKDGSDDDDDDDKEDMEEDQGFEEEEEEDSDEERTAAEEEHHSDNES
ncbi:uncharacterized protein LOC131163470 [Malania oleifera]|uniref:uncharacterized protein LOC131163470 n=1 Tax=Malania oleifera TaxID=397392 RepID=UPI0025ADFF23|nr:uncharacterized protein LOC131163470 [Malania oleifera]